MLRTFIDASVLFAALYSRTGKARDLVQHAYQKRVTFVLSQEVLNELERNILKKAPEFQDHYHELLQRLKPELVAAASDEDIADAALYTAAKDAHVIASAIAAKPDYLVTYDRKHLLDRPEVAARSGLKIVTPDVVVAHIGEEK